LFLCQEEFWIWRNPAEVHAKEILPEIEMTNAAIDGIFRPYVSTNLFYTSCRGTKLEYPFLPLSSLQNQAAFVGSAYGGATNTDLEIDWKQQSGRREAKLACRVG
jgi:hypothetical protein